MKIAAHEKSTFSKIENLARTFDPGLRAAFSRAEEQETGIIEFVAEQWHSSYIQLPSDKILLVDIQPVVTYRKEEDFYDESVEYSIYIEFKYRGKMIGFRLLNLIRPNIKIYVATKEVNEPTVETQEEIDLEEDDE